MLIFADKFDFGFVHLLLGPLCRYLSVDLGKSKLLHHDLWISEEDTYQISQILKLIVGIINLFYSVLGKF